MEESPLSPNVLKVNNGGLMIAQVGNATEDPSEGQFRLSLILVDVKA